MAALLEGKVAVVTGAGRGIGRAVAGRLAREGAAVVVADYGGSEPTGGEPSATVAETAAAEISEAGGKASACFVDVSTMEGGRRAVQQALDDFGRLDAMVCCAGIIPKGGLLDCDEDVWDRTMATNLKGHFTCGQAAAQVMAEQGSGRLVFFASRSAFGSASGTIAYSTSKAGIMGLTFTAAQELMPQGITTNCIFPRAATRLIDYVSETAGIRQGRPHSTEAAGTAFDPENIAPLVAYLLSDAAAHVNGQVFGVWGTQISLLERAAWAADVRSEGPWELEGPDGLIERIPQAFGHDLGLQPFQWDAPPE